MDVGADIGRWRAAGMVERDDAEDILKDSRLKGV